MPICSSGISSDLSRSSAAVRAYVPPFLLFPFSSLSPPSLPRFSLHPSSVPFLCSLPLPFLPPAVHTSFLSPASLQQPPFSFASACPHCFISLQPPCLSLWFCSFGPSPPPPRLLLLSSSPALLLPSLRFWIPAALLSEECRIFVPSHLYFCVFQKKLSGAGTISEAICFINWKSR